MSKKELAVLLRLQGITCSIYRIRNHERNKPHHRSKKKRLRVYSFKLERGNDIFWGADWGRRRSAIRELKYLALRGMGDDMWDLPF